MINVTAIRKLDRNELVKQLGASGEDQQELFQTACSIRNNGRFGRKVELRSVIEISNRCRQGCRYCTMGGEDKVVYFSLSREEILASLRGLASIGRRSFLVQSGENVDESFLDGVTSACHDFTTEFPDAKIILCMGNLPLEQYVRLRQAGATRYILKFETSRPDHYHYCKPKDEFSNRETCLQNLFNAGFQVGSGNIVGLPGQTADDLVDDLIFGMKYPFSMISSTRFISNERSEFRDYPCGDINLTLNFIALLRILHPDCLIPSTSSLALGNMDGQLRGLLAGCNTVTIHDGTAKNLKKEYPIYSDNRFTPSENYCRDLIKKAGMTPEVYLI